MLSFCSSFYIQPIYEFPSIPLFTANPSNTNSPLYIPPISFYSNSYGIAIRLFLPTPVFILVPPISTIPHLMGSPPTSIGGRRLLLVTSLHLTDCTAFVPRASAHLGNQRTCWLPMPHSGNQRSASQEPALRPGMGRSFNW